MLCVIIPILPVQKIHENNNLRHFGLNVVTLFKICYALNLKAKIINLQLCFTSGIDGM